MESGRNRQPRSARPFEPFTARVAGPACCAAPRPGRAILKPESPAAVAMDGAAGFLRPDTRHDTRASSAREKKPSKS
jgi:hypothetical protein